MVQNPFLAPMTMKPKICKTCQGIEKVRLKRGLCKYCYIKVISREQIEKIEAEFKSPWPYNEYLFKLYTRYVLGRVVTGSDPPVAKKMASILRAMPISKLTHWSQVYELSDEFSIGKSSYKNKVGCPIAMIGRLIDKDKKLLEKKEGKSLYRIYRCFPEREKVDLKEFVESSKERLSIAYIILHLRALLKFYQWAGVSLYLVSSEQGLEYLIFISKSLGIIEFREQVHRLKVFYHWAKEKKRIKANPFDVGFSLWEKLCPSCEKINVVPDGGTFCLRCTQHRKLLKSIEAFGGKLKKAPPYNQKLFQIYLKYLKRYRVCGHNWSESKVFVQYLKENYVSKLLSWKAINAESAKFSEYMGSKVQRGCPFVKIGHVLSEMKVIPFRDQDEVTSFDRNVIKLGPELETIARQYMQSLLKRHRRLSTVIQLIHRIRYFKEWVEKHSSFTSILEIDEQVAIGYFEHFKSNADYHRGSLHQFYRWCKKEGLIKHNPFEGIKPVEPLVELPICSKEQFKKLSRFIKNEHSDPEQAMMLALVLYFGFGYKELLYSSLDINDGCITIHVHMSPLSYAKKSHQRNPTLILPTEPTWFRILQKRYIAKWQERFSKLKNPSSHRPLFLQRRGLHNRPLSNSTLKREISETTETITGSAIPTKILRTTAGHIHTFGSDASLLTTMGWAGTQAFKYTWMPRKYHC